MATTESRTGFRLPWSTDRAASREASADPAEVPAAPTPATDVTTQQDAVPESGTAMGQAATGVAASPEEGSVSIFAPDAAANARPAAAPEAPVEATGTAESTDVPTPASPSPEAAAPVPAAEVVAPAPARRPTKFLADLTRAMQAAAEQARTATLEQFHADGTAVIEDIHARSATSADDLRRRADDDVAAIKDWSKAEIARIREETERRVVGRREQLEGQLERHAALVEHEIEKVRGRIAAFEADMGRFFDDLLQEQDPSVFAARAASLPEPPSFEGIDDDALAALLREPGVGVPAPEPEAVEVEAIAADVAEAAPVEAQAEVTEVTEAAAVDEGAEAASVETVAGSATWTEWGAPFAAPAADAVVEDASVDPGAAEPVAEAAPFDREAAMAAIEAAAAAAASLEAAEAEVAVEHTAPAADATSESSAAESAWSSPAPEAAADVEPVAEMQPEVDPRIAMLGLTPDFAAAETAAAEAAAADVDAVPEIAGDALEARLAGLVAGDDAPPAETVTTQLVVTGLVSVASIASFKRHVGRLPGVGHVGVSSGPDGEFVFAVEHEAATALRDLIPTLPGFGARVVGAADGVVQVSATDPQD